MKVLRTALFSAFLMICFMNIGNTQQTFTASTSTSASSPFMIYMEAYVDPANSQDVVVIYNIGAPQFSTAQIRIENTDIVIHNPRRGANQFTIDLSPYIGTSNPLGTHLECEVCNVNSNSCVTRTCIVVTSGQQEGGGN